MTVETQKRVRAIADEIRSIGEEVEKPRLTELADELLALFPDPDRIKEALDLAEQGP